MDHIENTTSNSPTYACITVAIVWL
jgi:hypothetical protein